MNAILQIGIGGIRPRASEEAGALNQRLGPLGHATFLIELHCVLGVRLNVD